MSDKTSVKWHEIINRNESNDLAFFDLYREYATALHEKRTQKERDGYWPFPKE